MKRFQVPSVLKVSGFLFVVVMLTMAGGFMAGFRWNNTSSYPIGVWKMDRSFRPDQIKGRIVVFCPPDTDVFREAKRRGYLPFGVCAGGYLPLAKKVVGVGGDRVEVEDLGVRVNGRLVFNSTLLKQDSKGRIMPVAESGDIPEGYIWLMSDYNRWSFDSRYFGAIEQERIQGALQPVWVWDSSCADENSERRKAMIDDKLQDMEEGVEVEMTPEEADDLGAFKEDALTEDEARASMELAEGRQDG